MKNVFHYLILFLFLFNSVGVFANSPIKKGKDGNSKNSLEVCDEVFQNFSNVQVCESSFYWAETGQTYYESGTYYGDVVDCQQQVLELTVSPNLYAEVYNYYYYNDYCIGQQGNFQVYGTPYSTVEYYLNGQPGSLTLDEWGQSWVNFQITNVYTDFYLTSVSLNGCSNSVYSYATIYAQSAPQLSPISGPTAVCPGSTEYYYSYNYNGGYNYYNDQVYYYLWPSEAGQIDSYSGVVTWNTNYTGFATIEANYYGMCGYDYETLNVEVVAPTPNTTVASSCDSYTWSETGETYSQSGTYYGSINGCQQAVLELTIVPSTQNITVMTGCDGGYYWPNNGEFYTQSGTYTGTTENCVTEVLELTIVPNLYAEVYNGYYYNEYCIGQQGNFQVFGTPNATVNYQINGQYGSINLDQWGNGQVYFQITDVYSDLYLTSASLNGCSSSVYSYATIYASSAPDLSQIFGPTTVCQGSSEYYYAYDNSYGYNYSQLYFDLYPSEAGQIDWYSGNVTWNSEFTGSATIMASISGMCGYDQEILNVEVVAPTPNTTIASSCNSYTWSETGETYTQSGTYYGVINNCQQAVLELTITPNSNNVTVASSCGSYTWSNNGATYTESGTYTGTTENCVTEVLELTITPNSNNVTVVSSCSSYTWSNNGETYTESGTYTGTTENCVTEVLELTITPNSNNVTVASSCGSYTWSNNGETYTESGTYTGTTENCVTEVLELTITPNSNNVTVASSCDSYTWSNNGQTYTESGTYTGTTENCVTEVLELTITPSTQNVTVMTGCYEGYYWPNNGEFYTQSGTYTGTTENCVTEVLELTIVPNLYADVYNNYYYNEYCIGQQGNFQVYGTPYSTVEYYLNGQPGSLTLDEWGQSWVNFQITNVYTDFYLTSVSLNGCSNSVYSYATIYAQSAPQLSPISGPTAVCPGSIEYYYSYNYNGGYNYYNDQVYYYLWPSEAGQIDSYSGVVTWNTNYTGFATIEANYYGMCGYDYETLNVEVVAPTPNTTVASSCDSYTWSETGETYSQSGTYYGSINGCQQAVLELTITPNSNNVTVASSCGSYTWSNNGETYTESGTYTGTTENCVTEVLELTITPNSNNVTVASSCGSYTWSNNGATYTESGTYTGTTENCVTEVLELTITPNSNNVTVASSCDSYTWSNNGQTYTESGTYTGTTENCVTEVLELTITPSTQNVTVMTGCYEGYYWPNNGEFYTQSGTYTGTTENCVTEVLELTIVPNLYADVYNNYYYNEYCIGQQGNFQVYGTPYSTVEYYLNGQPGSLTLDEWGQSWVNFQITNVYTDFYLTSVSLNGCSNSVYSYATIYAQPAPQLSPISGPTTVCPGSTENYYTYNYNGGYNYYYDQVYYNLWPSEAGQIDGYNGVVTWNTNYTGFATIEANYYGMCGYDYETLTVEVMAPTPNTTVASSCNSYTWSETGGTYTQSGTYYGSINGCQQAVLELTITPNSNNVTVASSCGSYTWSNNGETYTESGTYTGTTENCVTEVLELTITPNSNNVTVASSCGSYTWSNNGETYTESGTYTGTTENCVTEVLELTVNPIQTPTVSIATSDLDFMICSGTNVLFTATAVNGGSNPTYQWKINGVNVSGQNGPTFTTNSLTNGKIVTLQMISDAQCTSSNVAISNGIQASVGSCTKIQASQCGTIITSTSTSVWANSVSGATNYKFEFTDPSNNVFVYETANRYFKFSDISFTNNTTYSVRVAAKVGGSYLPYGAACDVRFEYQTKLVATQCGTSISSSTTVISAVNVSGSTGYRFEITDPNNNVFIVNSATRTFTFSQFAYQNNTTYSIRVAVQTANGYSSYGAACSVTFDKRTQLQASQCGISIDNSTTVITANSMAGATAYRFELTDMTTSNVYYVNSSTRSFTFSQFAYENNTTYSVRVSALTGTVYSAYGAACTVTFDKRTQLQASQCGITIDNPTTVITANSMAGATAYRFELTDMSTNNVYYVNSSTRNFTFSQFAYENNTTYSVRVSALTGTMYSAYGAPCTVTFDKRTELQAEQCGLVINGASKLVYANSINGATAYRFEVTNLLTNTVYFVNSQTNSFMFSQFAYSNSANYSVRVSYLIGNVYSAYGTACTIGLEILTKVQASQCGIQVSSASTLVWSGEITSASSYKFELTDLNNNVTYVENATRNFKFNQFTYTPGMTYSVRVSTKTGSIYSNYGQACNVTAPGAPGAKPGAEISENEEPIDVNGLEIAGVNELQNAFDFNAYPNPSNGDFTVTCSEAVSLKIVNEMGQYIQSIEVTEANGNKVQVTDLPNGAYFITGTVGGKVITKKVIVIR
jgi:hypothetical protein